jgi:hypothetical protein
MSVKEKVIRELQETGEQQPTLGGTIVQGGLENPAFKGTIVKLDRIGSYDNLEGIQDELDYYDRYGDDMYDALYCFNYESAQDVYDIFDYFSPVFGGTMKTKDFNAILQDFAQQTGMSLDIVIINDLDDFVAVFADSEGREIDLSFNVIF